MFGSLRSRAEHFTGRPARSSRGFWSSPFLWFAALLLVAEGFAYGLSPYRDYPQAATAYRNPNPHRGWPEYVGGQRAQDERLVVLVGTSQGVGLEFVDPARTLGADLRTGLASFDAQSRFENWSVSGLRSAQLELLTAQAVRRGVRVFVVLMTPGNIDKEYRYRLDTDSTDIHLLAGDPGLWPTLIDSAVVRREKTDGLLRRLIFRNSDLGRSRIVFLDYLASVLDSSAHRFVFGHVRPLEARFSIGERLARKKIPRLNSSFTFTDQQVSAGYWERQFRRDRLPTFRASYGSIKRMLEDTKASLIWVWSPVTTSSYDNPLSRGLAPIMREICARIEADGGVCVDFSAALGTDDFLNRGIASHLTEKGQAQLSELLLPLIRNALH